ncbi:MAG: phosphatase PAP2 family protein [Carbonactinosporaceae bacterium]
MRPRPARAVLGILVSCAGLVVIDLMLFGNGLVLTVDAAVHRAGFNDRWPEFFPMAKAIELFGQRAPTSVLAILTAAVLALRRHTLRPLLVLGGALLALNVVVGGLKLTTGRLKPRTDMADLFHDGGIIFPSGHAANVVLTWAVLSYLLVRFGDRLWRPGVLAGAVAAVSLGVGAVSVYLDTHWVSDIVVGWLVGAAIFVGTVLVDQLVDRYSAGRLETADTPVSGGIPVGVGGRRNSDLAA